tara:strand:- start:3020 stop:3172 length:153 start_codon:yes stop_codon:yes gene_type:complete
LKNDFVETAIANTAVDICITLLLNNIANVIGLTSKSTSSVASTPSLPIKK